MLLEDVADILAVLGSNMLLYTVVCEKVVPNAPPVQHTCIHYRSPRNLMNSEGLSLFSIHSSDVRYTLSNAELDKAMATLNMLGGMPGIKFDHSIEDVQATVLSITLDLCSDIEAIQNVQRMDVGMTVAPNFVITLHIERLPISRYSAQAKFFNQLTPNARRYNTFRLDLESIERRPLV